MREIFLAGKEPQERSTLLGVVLADRSAQHGIAGFKGIKDRALRDRTLDLELQLGANLSQAFADVAGG